MLGGGFIGQMHQTNKHNREMLRKEKRKPFDKNENLGSRNSEILVDNKKLSDEERQILVSGIESERKKEKQRNVLILLLSTVLTLLLFGFLYWMFASRLVEFLK
jgi:hypothetical protein